MSPVHPSETPPRRIAIIGGGISGIACAWKLRRKNCKVDLYESDGRLGGHANSVPFKGNGRVVNVDTGFITMEEATYPQFTAFLKELGVKTIPTDMSFGVSTVDGPVEWGSRSIRSFVGTFSNLFTLWFWRLAFDILRFSFFARDTLSEEPGEFTYHNATESVLGGATNGDLEDDLRNTRLEPIGEYLRRHGYSEQFMKYFLIPMQAAIWSIEPEEFARNFPAKPLIKFMSEHGLLDTVSKSLRWRSFRNGSKTYIDVFQQSLPQGHCIHLGRPVQSVSRSKDGASLKFSDGTSQSYDHVVLAVHANQALSLLGNDATASERRILGCFKTRKNVCYLHSDLSLLPKRPSARVAWNCLLTSQQSSKQYSLEESNSTISITFDMNRLQAIPGPEKEGSPGRVLVSMNPLWVPSSWQSRHVYYHPLISSESIIASRHLHKINGVSNVSFAGAWMGYGFHEDGFAAGAYVARMLVEGREKTGPFQPADGSKKHVVEDAGFFRSVLKVGIYAVQQLLPGWKLKKGLEC